MISYFRYSINQLFTYYLADVTCFNFQIYQNHVHFIDEIGFPPPLGCFNGQVLYNVINQLFSLESKIWPIKILYSCNKKIKCLSFWIGKDTLSQWAHILIMTLETIRDISVTSSVSTYKAETMATVLQVLPTGLLVALMGLQVIRTGLQATVILQKNRTMG